jgi:UDP-N-acetylglucosamine 2-epimerase (non-hydrolysing)
MELSQSTGLPRRCWELPSWGMDGAPGSAGMACPFAFRVPPGSHSTLRRRCRMDACPANSARRRLDIATQGTRISETPTGRLVTCSNDALTRSSHGDDHGPLFVEPHGFTSGAMPWRRYCAPLTGFLPEKPEAVRTIDTSLPLIHAICVAGARPNLIKIKPIIDAMESQGARTTFVHTGQHYDETMSGVFLEDLGLRQPDQILNVGSGSHAEQTSRVMTAFEPVVTELAPDMVIVVGDVNSTLGCALVAAKAGTLVAHVEAGLRSRDWSMPEEVNRVVTDRVSDYLFAPSSDAVTNLKAEGYRSDQIHLVGNVMVDSLLTNLDRAIRRDIVHRLGLREGHYALVTLHRPNNVDDDETLRQLIQVLGHLAEEIRVVFPVHPRTRTRLAGLNIPAAVLLTEPCGYLDFVALENGASLVLTDSGGVQEETTVLGVPCLTLRENTERPVTITEGTNQVVGHSPERILSAARDILVNSRPKRSPALWDGHAASRIAEILVSDDFHGRLRPTDLGVG